MVASVSTQRWDGASVTGDDPGGSQSPALQSLLQDSSKSPASASSPGTADSTLSGQLQRRLSNDLAARNDRQASLRISLSEDTYLGVGAFGLKNTPQSLVNWAFAGVNVNTLVNGAGSVAKLMGAKGNGLTNSKDMTLRVYTELALGQSDVFALSRVKGGFDKDSGRFQMRNGFGVVGVDVARKNGILGIGPGTQKGFDTFLMGGNVDFQKQTVTAMLPDTNTLSGQAVLGPMRGRDSTNLQTPAVKTVGYVWVDSSDPKHNALLSRVANEVRPGAGTAIRGYVLGEAVNNAVVHPKLRVDANGDPFVTTATVRGMTVIGLPTPSGFVVGAGLDGRMTIQAIEDGKDDIVIENPFGKDVVTNLAKLRKQGEAVLKPVTDMATRLKKSMATNALKQGQPTVFGSTIDPVKQQADLKASTRRAQSRLLAEIRNVQGKSGTTTPPIGRGSVTINGKTFNNVPALPGATVPGGSEAADKDVSLLMRSIAGSDFSGSAQNTIAAYNKLRTLPPQTPWLGAAVNKLLMDYCSGASRTVLSITQQVKAGKALSPAQAQTLVEYNYMVQFTSKVQHQLGLKPVLDASALQSAQQWANYALQSVRR